MKRFPFQLDVEVPLYLAPMAGVSESPFRRLCRRFGADVVVTEFLSAEGIRRENLPHNYHPYCDTRPASGESSLLINLFYVT